MSRVELASEMLEYMDATEMVFEIVRAMSEDSAQDILQYVAKNNEVPISD
jgi:uncharacterized protein YeeX (DUF496 family)